MGARPEMLRAKVAVAEHAISFMSHTRFRAVFDVAIPERHFEKQILVVVSIDLDSVGRVLWSEV